MSVGANRGVRDVIVLGGGPAGAATALLLARVGIDVAVLESTAFDGPRFGETLPPEVNPLLRALGLWDAFLATAPVPSPGTVSVWGSPEIRETAFIANRHGHGWHVDRNVFGALLCRAAASAGADVRTGVRAARCTRDAGGTWTVGLHGTGAGSLRARFVLDASGRNGTRLAPDDRRLVHDRMVAVFLRIAHGANVPADWRTLIESGPDGWWYCAPVPGGETVAVYFADPAAYAGAAIAIGDQLERAPATAARIGRGRILSSRLVHVPSSVRAAAAGIGWAAAGDAAAAYDPLSGFGIVKALSNARALAAAFTAGTFDGYAAGVRGAFDAYARQRRTFYASELRWAARPFWRARVAAHVTAS